MDTLERHLFIDDMIGKVRSLAPSMIIGTRMKLQKMGAHYKGLCPFHDDKHLGSFVVTDAKGIWKCFSCSAGGGDAIKFVSMMDKISYLEAAFNIALNFSAISEEEYTEYYARRRYSKDQVKRIEQKYVALDKKKFESHLADISIRDQVYRIFMDSATLSENHRLHLLNVRKLSEQEIKTFQFFTFPSRSILKEFMTKVNETFGSEKILEGIPGFYWDNKDQRFTFAYYKGIAFPICDAEGRVAGIQIRRDKVEKWQSRYIWFSSSFAADGMDAKYQKGTGMGGAPVDVVYPGKLKQSSLFITEGKFKAIQLAKTYGAIALSTQGVTTWRGILKQLELIPNSKRLKVLYPHPFQISRIISAYDADMDENLQIFEMSKKMTDALAQNKYPKIFYINWNNCYGKGIDDVILSGNQEKLKSHLKIAWESNYEKMIHDILSKEHIDLNTLRTNSKKYLQEKGYFKEYMSAML